MHVTVIGTGTIWWMVGTPEEGSLRFYDAIAIHDMLLYKFTCLIHTRMIIDGWTD